MLKKIKRLLFVIFLMNLNIKNNILYASVCYDKINLNLLPIKSKNKINISVISPNGNLAGGNVKRNDKYEAKIWYGKYFYRIKEIRNQFDIDGDGINISKFNQNTSIVAFSNDGYLAVGNITNLKRGIVWYGDQWNITIPLKTLHNKNGGFTITHAISFDGNVIGGEASVGKASHAVVWYGKNFQKNKDLGILPGIEIGDSQVHALSKDGKIAAGFSDSKMGKTATIWDGEKWENIHDLGENDEGQSALSSISEDGKIAAGYSDTLKGRHAFVWFGKNWSKKIDLGTLRKNNSGVSMVLTMSGDGKILAGHSVIDKYKHATIWYGRQWRKKLDLGTLEEEYNSDDDKGISYINSMSSDGTLAIGFSTSSISTGMYPVLWKIKFEQDDIIDIEQYDYESFKKSINIFYLDNLLLMEKQRLILKELQTGYFIDTGKIKLSFDTIYNSISISNTKNILYKINGNYGLTKNCSLGINLGKLNSNSLPQNYNIYDNIGLGIYSNIHNYSFLKRFYIQSSISFYKSNIDIIRPKYMKIEEGKGNTNFLSLSASIKAGQRLFISNKRYFFEWYTGINKNYFEIDKYIEDNISYKINYQKFNGQSLVFSFGSNISIPILEKMNFISGISLEKLIKKVSPFISSSNLFHTYEKENIYINNNIKIFSGIEFIFNKEIKIKTTINSGYSYQEKIYWGLNFNLTNDIN